jgi:hypothetical protein
MNKLRPVLTLAAFLFFAAPLQAQWFVGVKFMGLTFHPRKNPNSTHYDLSIGKKKRLVLNTGFAITAEYMFYPNVSVKLDQALFRDCAGKMAGMAMFNLRYTVSLGKLGTGSGGLGPFFFYRRDWNSFGDYVDEGFFRHSRSGKWQTKFVWYGGELEHDLPLGNGLDLSTNFFPGFPVVYALAPGVRTSAPEKN